MQKLKRKAILSMVLSLIAIWTIWVGVRYRRLLINRNVPVNVDFCDLARHPDRYWDRYLITSGEILHGIEGSAVGNLKCPYSFMDYSLSSANSHYDFSRLESEDGPYDPNLRITFGGRLGFPSGAKDFYYRVLRAMHIKTKGPGILIISRVNSLEKETK